MHATRNSLAPATRSESIAQLQAILSAAIDLRLQIKQAHWTVRGPNFIQLHELFDSMVPPMDEHVDNIAERIAQLGGAPDGTVQGVFNTSSFDAYPADIHDEMAHLKLLSERIAAMGKTLNTNIESTANQGDAVSSDLLTTMASTLEAQLWFLEAHIVNE